jgi:hypothetical protein
MNMPNNSLVALTKMFLFIVSVQRIVTEYEDVYKNTVRVRVNVRVVGCIIRVQEQMNK